MATDEISGRVRQFIFDYIDSVEQLEVLLFLRAHQNQSYTSEMISNEFRSSPQSIESRLDNLFKNKLVQTSTDETPSYSYFQHTETDQIVDEIISLYRLRRQTILELIFSPLKRGRQFAEAFIIKKSMKDDGESNG